MATLRGAEFIYIVYYYVVCYINYAYTRRVSTASEVGGFFSDEVPLRGYLIIRSKRRRICAREDVE